MRSVRARSRHCWSLAARNFSQQPRQQRSLAHPTGATLNPQRALAGKIAYVSCFFYMPGACSHRAMTVQPLQVLALMRPSSTPVESCSQRLSVFQVLPVVTSAAAERAAREPAPDQATLPNLHTAHASSLPTRTCRAQTCVMVPRAAWNPPATRARQGQRGLSHVARARSVVPGRCELAHVSSTLAATQ